jgi:hypothetical protein
MCGKSLVQVLTAAGKRSDSRLRVLLTTHGKERDAQLPAKECDFGPISARASEKELHGTHVPPEQ